MKTWMQVVLIGYVMVALPVAGWAIYRIEKEKSDFRFECHAKGGEVAELEYRGRMCIVKEKL